MSGNARRNSLSKAKVRTRIDSTTSNKLDYYHRIVEKTILQYQVRLLICLKPYRNRETLYFPLERTL
jgi:hypothetical protein